MPDSRKIPLLIISYLFPPRGGVGVQRIAKIVKYLPQNGFEPIVLTVSKPSGAVAEDKELQNEIPSDIKVIRTSSFEPYHIYRALGGKKTQDDPSFRSELVSGGEGKKGLLAKLYFEYQRRCLIPDPKIGWFRPAYNAGVKIFAENLPKLIFSTSPEATAHLIALKLHERFKVPFVADFRDPWTAGYYSLNRPEKAALKELRMEESVLGKAGKVTVVMKSYIDGFREKHPSLDLSKCIVIPNGFDDSDYKDISPRAFEKFVIAHTGSVYLQRSPVPLFQAVAEFLQKNPDAVNDFKVLFLGKVDTRYIQNANEIGISKVFECEDFAPHKITLSTQLGADVLAILSEGVMTAKVYEYLRASKPVIGFAPEGELSKQVKEWGIGKIFTPDQVSEAAKFIETLYLSWKEHKTLLWSEFHSPALSIFERSHQVKQLASVFRTLLT